MADQHRPITSLRPFGVYTLHGRRMIAVETAVGPSTMWSLCTEPELRAGLFSIRTVGVDGSLYMLGVPLKYTVEDLVDTGQDAPDTIGLSL